MLSILLVILTNNNYTKTKIMSIATRNIIDQETSLNSKRKKPIHKQSKGGKKKMKDQGMTISYSSRQQKKLRQKYKANAQSQVVENANFWEKYADNWCATNPLKIQECMDEELNKLPTLNSIEELFSLSPYKKLTPQPDLNCFYRFCRVISFIDCPQGQNILLQNDQAFAVGHIVIDRQGSKVLNSIIPLSSEEMQMIQKRESFMEKLKENESKYDASITRMSDISKELAFTYRIYLQKRNQINQACKLISAKIPPQKDISETALFQYSKILIKKNLQQTFLRQAVDPLNYFKFKEYSETDRLDQFQHIRNIGELKIYIQKRKPKRGRKLLLPTACSVCLSDYHELSNPFQSCSVCGLRAHQMCFSFQESRCGYCTYQKVQRHIKEEVSCCFICRQPGIMTIKFSDHQYAHGFCLLIHGSWRVTTTNRVSFSKITNGGEGGDHLIASVLQAKNRKNCSYIEFLNPQEISKSAISVIHPTDLNKNQFGEIQAEDNNSSLGDIGIIRQIQAWQHQNEAQRQNCTCCQQKIYRKLYLTCKNCGNIYHAFCAFLSGFDLKIIEHAWLSDKQDAISLNCCCEESEMISWSRKYKLNYERVALKVQSTALNFEKISRHIKNDLGLYENTMIQDLCKGISQGGHKINANSSSQIWEQKL